MERDLRLIILLFACRFNLQLKYYPFELKHQGYNSSSLAGNVYQYKYNGKELQETGMYDYGVRMYMPD